MSENVNMIAREDMELEDDDPELEQALAESLRLNQEEMFELEQALAASRRSTQDETPDLAGEWKQSTDSTPSQRWIQPCKRQAKELYAPLQNGCLIVEKYSSRVRMELNRESKAYPYADVLSEAQDKPGLRLLNRTKSTIVVTWGKFGRVEGFAGETIFVPAEFLKSERAPVLSISKLYPTSIFEVDFMKIQTAAYMDGGAFSISVRRPKTRENAGLWSKFSVNRKADAVGSSQKAAAVKIQAFFRGLMARTLTRCHVCWSTYMHLFMYKVLPSAKDQSLSDDYDFPSYETPRLQELLLRPAADASQQTPPDPPFQWPVSFTWRVIQREYLGQRRSGGYHSWRKAQICVPCVRAEVIRAALDPMERKPTFPGLPSTKIPRNVVKDLLPQAVAEVKKVREERSSNAAAAIQAAWRGFRLRRHHECQICLESVPRGFMVGLNHGPIDPRPPRAQERLRPDFLLHVARASNIANRANRRNLYMDFAPSTMESVASDSDSGEPDSDDDSAERLAQEQRPVDTCRCCLACWKKHIQVSVDEGRFAVRCLFHHTCKTLLDDSTLKTLAGKKAVDQLKENRGREHAGYVAALRAGDAEPDFLAWANTNTRVCPTCSVIIYRCSGCDHMVCTCGRSFDWAVGPRLEAPVPDSYEDGNNGNDALNTNAGRRLGIGSPWGNRSEPELGFFPNHADFHQRPRRRSRMRFLFSSLRRLIPFS